MVIAGNSVFRSSYAGGGSAQGTPGTSAAGEETAVRRGSTYVRSGPSGAPKKTIAKKRAAASRSGKKPIARQPFWWSDKDTAAARVGVVDLTGDKELEETVVWTDGSCLGNQFKNGRRRAGVGAFFGDNDPRNVSMKLPGELQTNQRAEVYVRPSHTRMHTTRSH